MKLNKRKIFVIMSERGMNRRQLQQETGISPASLRYAVAGISSPRPETAEKIATALGVPVEEILEIEST